MISCPQLCNVMYGPFHVLKSRHVIKKVGKTKWSIIVSFVFSFIISVSYRPQCFLNIGHYKNPCRPLVIYYCARDVTCLWKRIIYRESLPQTEAFKILGVILPSAIEVPYMPMFVEGLSREWKDGTHANSGTVLNSHTPPDQTLM